jgi:hypothetical protein
MSGFGRDGRMPPIPACPGGGAGNGDWPQAQGGGAYGAPGLDSRTGNRTAIDKHAHKYICNKRDKRVFALSAACGRGPLRRIWG